MQIEALPAFIDNYIWLLRQADTAVVVDPGDAGVVIDALQRHGLRLKAILLTHHHADHTAGVAALQAHVAASRQALDVYGPAAETARIPTLNRPLHEGDSVDLPSLHLRILEVPGHTLGHIAYHCARPPLDAGAADDGGLLFCGDTLFSAGCGRLFEGTPMQMLGSLNRLRALPDNTRVFCTHEYTTANLQFALAVEPSNPALLAHAVQVHALRSTGLPSLPSRLGLEKAINPFLRCQEPAVIAAASRHAGQPLDSELAVFTVMRAWKDHFRSA